MKSKLTLLRYSILLGLFGLCADPISHTYLSQ